MAMLNNQRVISHRLSYDIWLYLITQKVYQTPRWFSGARKHARTTGQKLRVRFPLITAVETSVETHPFSPMKKKTDKPLCRMLYVYIYIYVITLYKYALWISVVFAHEGE